MKKTHAISACAAIAFLALSGCMRMVYDVTLSPDGTASGEILIAYQEAVLLESGLTEEDVFSEESMAEMTAELGNATVADYSQDGYVGRIVAFTGQSIDEFAVEGGEGFSREGDDFVFRGSIVDEETVTSFEDPTMTGYDQPEFRLSITFPGEVYEHNGVLSGKTVTWDTDLLLSGEEAYARGSALPGVIAPTEEPDDEDPTPGDDVTPTEDEDADEDEDPVRPKSNGDSNSDLWKWALIGGLGASGVGLMWFGMKKSNAKTAA